ncbi:hypothetical protein GJV26_29310 [Massilia dura]|uniref:Type IV pilus biogenesis protein PilP n=1 Tax=Pseudoduganella dura TaxID=321982 RepID=A0A6I3XIU7_9BURK|nr:hypothetical protein [Pseudoduganella dura]MUI16527.1 hypothetical protein [Pseudoduganella dura]GGY21165.1 hypothetical protein GCM10007386_57490 [Pseudoduganella dura]
MSRALHRPARPGLSAALLAAALCLAAPPVSAQYTEPALGRLFTAPDERMRLDRDRASAPTVAQQAQAQIQVQEQQAAAAAMTGPAAGTPAPPPAPLRLTGVVRRSDGRATVWIDDEPRETTLARYKAGGAIPVETPRGSVLVKPGQSVDPNDGTIREPR